MTATHFPQENKKAYSNKLVLVDGSIYYGKKGGFPQVQPVFLRAQIATRFPGNIFDNGRQKIEKHCSGSPD